MICRLLATIILLTATAFAHPSVSVVVDRKGNVYYSDLKQVWRVDAQGTKSVVVPNVHTHELWLDSSDALYGEHLWYTGPQDGSGKWFHRVWQRSADGHMTDVVPTTEGFRTTFSFARDAQGNGYMTEESSAPKIVRVIDASGRGRLLAGGASGMRDGDRKSTRLNSSHRSISYAVFCLKKKKRQKQLNNINKIKINLINKNITLQTQLHLNRNTHVDKI